MTEGLELVLREAFTTLKLHRIEANIEPGNARLDRAGGPCGFVKEGFSSRYLKIGGRWRTTSAGHPLRAVEGAADAEPCVLRVEPCVLAG